LRNFKMISGGWKMFRSWTPKNRNKTTRSQQNLKNQICLMNIMYIMLILRCF